MHAFLSRSMALWCLKNKNETELLFPATFITRRSEGATTYDKWEQVCQLFRIKIEVTRPFKRKWRENYYFYYFKNNTTAFPKKEEKVTCKKSFQDLQCAELTEIACCKEKSLHGFQHSETKEKPVPKPPLSSTSHPPWQAPTPCRDGRVPLAPMSATSSSMPPPPSAAS